MEFLIKKFQDYSQSPAIIWNDNSYTYKELLVSYIKAIDYIHENGVKEGEIVSLTGDFTPNTISLMFALIYNNNIIV